MAKVIDLGSEGPEKTGDVERRRKQAALDRARDLLEAHGFDAIVLIVSYVCEDGGTAMLQSNSGNWYAQNGMMTEMMERRSAQTAVEATKPFMDEENG